MKRTELELLPGVRLTVLQTDKFKTDCISVNLVRPLAHSEAALNALLPNVLLRGCELCPDMRSISAYLDERYGAGMSVAGRKRGEVQTTGFYLDYVDQQYTGESLLGDMCRLLGSFLLHPVLEDGAFRRDYVESEKANQINAIMAQINDKRAYAARRLRQEMCRDEAYGVDRLGTVAETEGITPQSLFAHYRRILTHSRIELLYCGQAEGAAVAEALEKELSALPRGDFDRAGTTLGPVPQEVRTVVETMDVTQSKLVMGLRAGVTAGDRDYPAMVLMNSVFGGGLTSKLFLNVREKLSLCYYASSGLDRFKGMMVISSGVDAEAFDAAKEEILRQLEACRAGEISKEELESARRYLVSVLRSSTDFQSGMEDFYLGQILGGFSYTPDELADRLETVSVPEIQAAAGKLRLDTIYFLKGAQ